MIRTLFFLLLASPALADTVVATRTIPARAIIGVDDVALRDLGRADGLEDTRLVVGQETRVALYAGRPIHSGDIGPPAVVERNQIIQLIYQNGAITISTEARALDRAAPGETIRVMNLSSRTTVPARIDENGTAVADR